MKTQPKALSFDLDDTLWPCDDVIGRAESALYAWLERHFPAIPARYSLDDMRRHRQEAAARDPALAVDMSRLRVETLRRHAREAGYGEGMAEAGLDVFLGERQRVTLYPEVRFVLEELRRMYPLVALTNGNACVERVGLGEFFAVSLSAADVGAAKPDPAMFRAACTELSVRPGDLLHVGDDPLRDVHAARSLGAGAVWVNRTAMAWPEGLRRAHHEMEDLVALPSLLADVDVHR
jgi:FMN hydrolase / 5-amino-6-(5-phospho-D-ribitylamino)uracil phosphatase